MLCPVHATPHTQATASNMLASMLDDVTRNMTGFQTQ